MVGHCVTPDASRQQASLVEVSPSTEIRLNELAKVEGDVVDMDALYRADILPIGVTRAKIILSGAIDRAVTVRGLGATKGARAAIDAAGGKVQD